MAASRETVAAVAAITRNAAMTHAVVDRAAAVRVGIRRLARARMAVFADIWATQNWWRTMSQVCLKPITAGGRCTVDDGTCMPGSERGLQRDEHATILSGHARAAVMAPLRCMVYCLHEGAPATYVMTR